MNEKGLSIIIPAFNEEDGITDTVKTIQNIFEKCQFNIEVIFVNDGSTDTTLKKLNELSDSNKYFKIINHNKNNGYGASLKTGISASKFDYVAITDADETYPNHKIIDFYNKAVENNLDMIVGARIGANVKIPLIRKPAKWFLNKLANYLSDQNIPDLNSGLRVMKKDSVLKYFKILPQGFSFTTTITLAMLTNNHKVVYEKIEYFFRAGSSKIRPIYDTLNFFQLIIRTILFFQPLKIFLPLSLIMIITGIIMILYRIFFGEAFGVISTVIFIGAIQTLAIGMLADLINRKL